MYIYIYIHIHTYIHTYIHTFIHSYIHTFIHSYIHTFIHTYIHTFIHSFIHSFIVVGDVFRRLVARTLAQHYAAALQTACMPFQFGLSTRAGTEALFKLLQVATECNSRATVLSVDAVGAFDHVSRQAMLEALRSRPELEPLLPFCPPVLWRGQLLCLDRRCRSRP